MDGLRSTVTETLDYSDRYDLLPYHELTAIEDEETLAGADAHTVRQILCAWVADDLYHAFLIWTGTMEPRGPIRNYTVTFSMTGPAQQYQYPIGGIFACSWTRIVYVIRIGM